MRLKKLLLIMVLGFAGASPALTKPQMTSSRPQPPPGRSFYLVDEGVGASTVQPPLAPTLECDSSYTKGDCDRNQKSPQQADLVRLLNAVYLNSDGTYCPFCLADMNCDRLLTATDAVWFIRYFYLGFPTPRKCP